MGGSVDDVTDTIQNVRMEILRDADEKGPDHPYEFEWPGSCHSTAPTCSHMTGAHFNVGPVNFPENNIIHDIYIATPDQADLKLYEDVPFDEIDWYCDGKDTHTGPGPIDLPYTTPYEPTTYEPTTYEPTTY